MKPTKEQIIEWTGKAEQDEKGNLLPLSQVFERLAAAAYANGQEDMRERCANTVDKIVTDRNPTTEQRLALQIASEAVRALPTQKGGKG